MRRRELGLTRYRTRSEGWLMNAVTEREQTHLETDHERDTCLEAVWPQVHLFERAHAACARQQTPRTVEQPDALLAPNRPNFIWLAHACSER
jgi:hypothetical protein